MPQKTDLYSILDVYCRKNNIMLVDTGVFIDFLENHAKKVCREKPEWERWAEDTGTRVWQDLARLQKEGKLVLSGTENSPQVFMFSCCTEPIEEGYKNPDADADLPFPDEKFLHLHIPSNQLIYLGVAQDLPGFLREGHETAMPLKLIFPGNYGEAIALASMLPFTMLEHCFIKLQKYLKRRNNKQYIQGKLTAQFTGREEQLRELMDRLVITPTACINDLITGREFAFHFWFFFCAFIKNELGEKSFLLPEEKAVLQSICLLEVCGAFFRNKAVKAKETDMALKIFEAELDKPPYYFSREAIADFKDGKGNLLLGQYTKEELDAYIKKLLTGSSSDVMPELMYFRDRNETHWLIKKSKLLPLCARLFMETRLPVIKFISLRWKKILLAFEKEPAMDNDSEFEKLVVNGVRKYVPMLTILLEDPRLFLVYEEVRERGNSLSESSRLYSGSELLPLRILLMIQRRELLSDIKLLLPFWYTFPIISRIAAFFQRFGNKKKRAEDKNTEQPRQEPRDSALEAEIKMIPEGHTLNSYLLELAGQWGKLLNKKEMAKLVHDVNIIIRDKLRYITRTQKNINRHTLDSIASSIIQSSPGLNEIHEQKPLALYIKLYLVSLLSEKNQDPFPTKAG